MPHPAIISTRRTNACAKTRIQNSECKYLRAESSNHAVTSRCIYTDQWMYLIPLIILLSLLSFSAPASSEYAPSRRSRAGPAGILAFSPTLKKSTGHPRTMMRRLKAEKQDDDDDNELSSFQVAQTIGYRAANFATAGFLSVQAAAPLLQEAGLSGFQDVAGGGGPFLLSSVTAACLLVPKNFQKGGKLASIIEISTFAEAIIASWLVHDPVIFGMSAICLREIVYFGVAYKIEAVVFVLAGVLQLPDAVVALSFAVLCFGKLFEPLAEDWKVTESEFLATNVLEDSKKEENVFEKVADTDEQG